MEIKIDKNNVEDILPLTPMQEGFLFHHILDNKNTEYFEQLSIEIKGDIDGEIFRTAWQSVVDNNEMLRTIFVWDKLEKNVQVILKNNLIEIYDYDISGEQNKEEALLEIKLKDREKGFDLRNVPFRITLCKKESQKYEMIISNHHIVLDGWSTTIILKEFFEAYSTLFNKGTLKNKCKTRFKDAIKTIAKKDNEEQFWREYFHCFEGQDKFKLNYLKESKNGTKETYIFNLKKTQKEINEKLQGKKNVSTAALLLGSWGILMQKYLNIKDVNFGIILSGREALIDGIDDMVGLFINTLPLRVQTNPGESIERLLEKINHNINALKEYQATKLVDINQYIGQSDLFDTIVAIENYPLNIDTIENEYLKASSYYIDGSTNYDLTVGIQLFEESISVNIGYNNGVFSKNQIEKLALHYNNIVNYVVENITKNVAEIEMLNAEEINEVLYEPNDTKVIYERFLPIHKVFEEEVRKNPDNTAIVFEDRRLTYRELNEKADKLAFTLKENGIGSEKIVALVLNRSIESVVSILGVLKSGGAFLPIDIEIPMERKAFMIKDSDACALITYKNRRNEITFNGPIIDIDDESSWCDAGHIVGRTKENDLAYIIYTSGTTGKPKGVMVEHKGLTNIAHSWNKHYRLKDFTINLLQLSNFSFDVFIGDVCKSFLNGGKMVICPKDTRIEVTSLYNLIRKEEITMFDSNPTLICNLMDYVYENNLAIDNLKLIIFGADACPVGDFKRVYERFGDKIRLLNGYGITEATIESSYYEVDSKIGVPYTTVPIGISMCNTRHYILGLDLNPLPTGVIGELFIAGDCLARGYLNNEDLTNEKFIEDPFFPGQKMYKTGDLARWLDDGNIEFLGRKDNQIKIRGFRIETGEIENVLLEHIEIKEAVVIALEENEDKFMCAYYVSPKEIEKEEIRSYLLKQLPEYMVPHNFVKIDAIPLTPHGKVDKKSLKNLKGKIVKEIVGPRTEMEEKLSVIWKEVLKKSTIDVKTNFFEIGGNSLNATSLMAKTCKRLGVNVPLMEIFNHSTIEDMAEFIENSTKKQYVKIKKAEIRETYPMSSAQRRIFLLQKMDKQMVAYNMSTVLLLNGFISKDKIEETFVNLIKRHEAFRTSFEMLGEEAVQRVHEHVDFSIEYKDMEMGSTIESEVEKFIRPFDFEIAPLIRVGLIRQKEDEHLLIVDIHHIISDGISVSIIIDEFTKLYNDKTLSKVDYEYRDYAVWQQAQVKENKIKEKEDYWKNNLGGELPVLNLPTDYPRPSIQSYEGDTLEFCIGEELTTKLNNIARENNATLFMVLLSGLKTVLHKYTSQEDLIVGTPIAGRSFSEFENIVGMFVNLLAIRSYPSGEKTFRSFLNEVKEISLKAFENQEYQFEDLIEILDQKRDISRNPIFDIVFAMENMEEELTLGDLKIKPIHRDKNVSKFDITLYATEKKDSICFNIEYCTKLFKREFIENFYNHYINLLEEVCNNVDIEISKIQLAGEAERFKLITGFNDTKKEYPKNCTIHELFEERVTKNPNEVAVIFEDGELTYSELNSRANSLARVLREKGIGADDIVGLMTKRSKEMIIGIFAILKAGGAYLPIDIEIPEERLAFIIKDSKLKLVLTDSDYIDSSIDNVEIVDLKDNKNYLRDTENLGKVNHSNNLAYVIYTSGSTGSPKGVMVEHHSVINRLNWMQNQYPLTKEDTILQKTPYTFDVSVWELFWWSFTGAKVCFLKQDGEKDPKVIMDAIVKNGVTTIHFVPSMLNVLLRWLKDYDQVDQIKELKRVFVSGEALMINTVNQYNNLFLNNHRPKLINLYGPTEATVDVTYYECGKTGDLLSMPIGKPIDNISIYILDKKSSLQPIGIPGELCIGGAGVARGYLNKPELTLEKFIDSPFHANERIYRTGDLARWLQDGNIEFLGRMDTQVKLRGYRIELGEIENAIIRNKKITECVVTLIDDDGDKAICAYYVGEDILQDEIKSELSSILPSYMIPSYFVKLDKIPLNKNGKIDKNNLPKVSMEGNSDRLQPRNEIERKILEIWKEVLRVDNIGIDEDFFDLGGHSLKATKLITRLNSEINVAISLMDIFEYSTIESLGNYVSQAMKKDYDRIEKAEPRPYYPVSSAQRRMYLMQKLEEESIAYNIPTILVVDGIIDRYKIENAFKGLIKRHEAFRTSFETIGDELVQKISEDVEFNLDYMEISDESNIYKEVHSFMKPFDLSKAPLMRAGLIKQSDNKHILMVNMHHIISDGTSADIIIDEFSKFYNEENLRDIGLEYKDYAVWQQQQKNEMVFKDMESYWKDVLKGELPVLKLPLDFERPKLQSFEGDILEFEITKELTEAIKGLAKNNHATLYMVLLAGFKTMLYKYSGQEDIIVGTPMAGRNHAGIERTIGMFVNMLAMRSFPKGELTFKEYLDEIREITLNAYENQDYQFEDLLDILNYKRDVSTNPIFNTVFTLQNMDIREVEIGDAKISPYPHENKESKFDLCFIISEKQDRLAVSIEYSTKLFKEESVVRIFEHFKSVLEQVTMQEGALIKSIKMITEQEKQNFILNNIEDNCFTGANTADFDF